MWILLYPLLHLPQQINYSAAAVKKTYVAFVGGQLLKKTMLCSELSDLNTGFVTIRAQGRKEIKAAHHAEKKNRKPIQQKTITKCRTFSVETLQTEDEVVQTL